MKKLIRNILIFIYAIIAIFTTICLLSFNKFKITEFGEYSLLIINSSDLEPDFKKGDLVILDRTKKPQLGESAFFYNVYNQPMTIGTAKITNEEKVNATEITYTLEDGKTLSSSYMIGSSDGAKTISKVGTVLKVLESKWGFLFLIVFPTFIFFLYEIVEVVGEIKAVSKENKKSEK